MLDFHDAEDFSCGLLACAVYSGSWMLTYQINMLPASSWLKWRGTLQLKYMVHENMMLWRERN